MKTNTSEYIYSAKINRMSNSQKGLSLIELLIAMIIGLFLLAGITTSYLSSKKSSIQRNQYSLLEDNGRLALEVLTNTIKHIGYSSSSGAELANKFMNSAVASHTCKNTTGSSVKDTTLFSNDSTTDDASNGDTIGASFYGDNILSNDCSGGPLPTDCQWTSGDNIEAARIYNSFYIDNSTEELMCVGSRTDSAQVIAEGIENMQILYGVDENSDNSADRYVNGDNVSDNAWSQVVSVQVGLLVRSLKETKDKAGSQTFTLLDEVVTSPNDRFQRAVFSTTITLRNSID